MWLGWASSGNADVRQWFGSTEIGVIGYTCERGCYHVTSGNWYLEVLDDAGKPLEPGTIGSIVLSTLGRSGPRSFRYGCGDRRRAACRSV